MRAISSFGLFAILLLLMLTLPLFVGCSDDDDDDNDSGGGGDDDDDDNDDDDNDDNDDDDNDDDDTPVTTTGFVYIPAGSFTMGSPEGETGRRFNETAHPVTLTTDFEMMETEVTQSQFAAAMGYNPSFFPVWGEDEERPVEMVTWFDALALANKYSEDADLTPCFILSDIECADGVEVNSADKCRQRGGITVAEVELNGVDSVYACEGFRLPTEAEWEYAARAETTTPFFNGQLSHQACDPTDENLDAIAWYCANAERVTHSVAQKQVNPWGLFDINGNVAEWTWDWYENDYPDTAQNPVGGDPGNFKVTRGGSIRYDGALRCRNAYRAGHHPETASRYLGFRLNRSLPSEEIPEVKTTPSVGHKATYTNDVITRALPDSLPFDYTRTDMGTPMTPTEITEFTQKITSFWDETDYFHWVLWTGHGMDASNPWGMPDYKLYWQDTMAIKNGDVVTFEHRGGADNLMIRTGKIYNAAASIYLTTGDATMGRIVEQYSKGVVALIDGMAWDVNDPETFIMTRALFTQDHTYTEEGREAAVVYGPAKVERYDWNAHTIPNPNNPYWGDIWLRTMRSKDDVPHILRMVPFMMWLAQDAPDASVKQAAQKALLYLQNFSKDVTDSGYYIRNKDNWGNAYVPLDGNGLVNDLASFVNYIYIVPNAECTNRMAVNMIAYGDPLDQDCGNGIGGLYEFVATYQHYFNNAIIWYFHIAALENALMAGQNDIALEMMHGLEQRADEISAGTSPLADDVSYAADSAAYLVAMAASGLPLTSQEAVHIVEQYTMSVDHYIAWGYWDLWNGSIPDGEYNYRPSNAVGDERFIREPEMNFILEYCFSPFRNESGAQFVDCNVVLDPSQWGE